MGFSFQHPILANAVIKKRLSDRCAENTIFTQADIKFPIFISPAHCFVIPPDSLPNLPGKHQGIRKLIKEQLFVKIIMFFQNAARFTDQIQMAKNDAWFWKTQKR